MIAHYALLKEVHDQHHKELMREVETDRLLRALRASRPSRRGRIMSGVGSALIAIGYKLEGKTPCSTGMPSVASG
jgi:hypothetical protein